MKIRYKVKLLDTFCRWLLGGGEGENNALTRGIDARIHVEMARARLQAKLRASERLPAEIFRTCPVGLTRTEHALIFDRWVNAVVDEIIPPFRSEQCP